jgi:tetratricopeptide (TPR) repeat protein
LAAYVGVRDNIDPAPAAKGLVDTGEKLIAAARDPGRKARLQWELGMALYDAVQICQMRSEPDNALKYGQAAAGYLADASKARPSGASTGLLGRLYFRLGTIHSMHNRDHKAAVAWFDKAVPLLERATPEELAGDLSRRGEAFVGMGVSYWEIGRRDEALALTTKGIQWMEQAAKQGTLDRSALAVPYGNLAAMHRKLGADDLAKQFQEMATRAKSEKLK